MHLVESNLRLHKWIAVESIGKPILQKRENFLDAVLIAVVYTERLEYSISKRSWVENYSTYA